MLEPEIRYCTTEDGVSIAYYSIGEGPPLVRASMPSHLSIEWQQPLFAHNLQQFAAEHQLVRFDGRKVGLSGPAPDFSLDGRVGDIKAVVDHLGLRRFALMGSGFVSLETIKYAALYPDQVSHLVLMTPFADGQKLYGSSPAITVATALESLIGDQWDFFVNTTAGRVTGYHDPEAARSFVTLFKACFTPELFLTFREENRRTNATSFLGSIQAPTLVLGSEGEFFPLAIAREIAGEIPHARFKLIPEPGPALMLGDATMGAILDFLRPEGASRPVRTPNRRRSSPQASGTAIILFADIVDSTALTERIGDTAFREKARTLDDALRIAVRDHGGAAIDGKLLGDGILATFPAASQAIAAALSFAGAAAASQLQLHVGLHAGDVIREQDAGGQTNVYGGAVNIAARISALAAPGEVLVSDTVRSLARTSAGVTFEDRGDHALKGIAEPQRVFAVRKDGN